MKLALSTVLAFVAAAVAVPTVPVESTNFTFAVDNVTAEALKAIQIGSLSGEFPGIALPHRGKENTCDPRTCPRCQKCALCDFPDFHCCRRISPSCPVTADDAPPDAEAVTARDKPTEVKNVGDMKNPWCYKGECWPYRCEPDVGHVPRSENNNSLHVLNLDEVVAANDLDRFHLVETAVNRKLPCCVCCEGRGSCHLWNCPNPYSTSFRGVETQLDHLNETCTFCLEGNFCFNFPCEHASTDIETDINKVPSSTGQPTDHIYDVSSIFGGRKLCCRPDKKCVGC